MKIRIFSDYCDSTGAKGAFKSWAFGKSEYKNIEIVDTDDYTHAIILNNGKFPTLTVPKQNVIGFHQEVPEFMDMKKHVDWLEANCKTYYVYDKNYMNHPFTKEWYTFLPNLPLYDNRNVYKKEKKHTMSIIASDKDFLEGHLIRHNLIKKILKSDLDIHIYGRGCHLYSDPMGRIKGEIEDKSLAFSEYNFTIVVENLQYRYWITEKFVDPIICGCTPIYWGATEIDSVFGADSHLKLTHSIDDMFNYITAIYNHPNSYIRQTDIALDRLYSDANFAEFIIKAFQE